MRRKITWEEWVNSNTSSIDFLGNDKINWIRDPDWLGQVEDKGDNAHDFSNSHISDLTISRASAEFLNFRNSVFENVLFDDGDFSYANFDNCQFINTKFNKTIFTKAGFNGATFFNCNLNRINLTNADFCVKSIEETVVYGVSAWNIITCEDSIQSKLVIEETYGFYSDIIEQGRIPMMVDDIELAQFVFYLINHKKMRDTIRVLNSRSVLLLGRFKNGGLERLYRIREWLLAHNYLPMIFDFEPLKNQDLVETIVTMGALSKFVIADLSGPFVETELQEISNLYIKPIILFHSDQPNRPNISFKAKNNFIHNIHFDGSEDALMKEIELKVSEIDKNYNQFVIETNSRSETKYQDGRSVEFS